MKKSEREHKKLLVLGMHADNFSNIEICKQLDVSDSFVGTVLREKGLKGNRKANTRITDDQEAEAIKLVSSGMSYAKAARALGMSDTTVRNICKKRSTTISPENGSSNDFRNEPSDQLSPVSQIIKGLEMTLEGLEMMLEGFKRLE